MTTTDEHWTDRAVCRTEKAPLELFFPPRGDGPYMAREARTYCRRCPVREQCLEASLRENEQDGLWGGYSPKERRMIRKLRQIGLDTITPPTVTRI